MEMKKLVMSLAMMFVIALPLMADTETVDGYTWTYRISGETAEIYNNDNCAISPEPTGAVTIPATLGGYPVTSIGYQAFSNCTYMTGVTIPASVTNIGEGVFYGCSGMQSLTVPFIPSSGRYLTYRSQYDSSYYTRSGLEYLFTRTESYRDSFEVYTDLGYASTENYTRWEIYGNIPASLKTIVITQASAIGESAFEGCVSISRVELPNSVTNIGNSAFSGCSGLTSVTIPGSVTSIGNSAFSGCRGLTSVTIPNSVTSIGYRTFYDCSGLTIVTIPSSVTNIGSEAFSGCSGLVDADGFLFVAGILYGYFGEGGDVVIPSNATRIEQRAFYNCTNMTSVTIPNSVTNIASEALKNCNGLTSVTIGNGVTSIGSEAFYGCTNLTSVTIPDGVTSIGSKAFSGCSGLMNMTIPGSVTSIGEEVFYGCSGMQSLTLPFVSPGREYYGDFNGYFVRSGLEYLFTSMRFSSGYITGSSWIINGNVPATLKTVVVTHATAIGAYAFKGCVNISHVELPSCLTSIANSAFEGCSGLTGVYISDLSAWCRIAFGNSTANPLYHAHNLYLNGTLIRDLTIPAGVTSIDTYAFCNCSGLTSVAIPSSIMSVGSDAFVGCNGLTGVYISDLSAWCRVAFDSATANPLYYAHDLYLNGALIRDLTVPSNVTSVGAYAFYNCSSLTNVVIPNSVTSIGNQAFYGCSGLTSVTAPSLWAFSTLFPAAYSNIESVVVASGSSGIVSGAFRGCTSLTDITIPDTVTSIGDEAFYNCTSLETLTIPGNVTSYGVNCFEGCPAYTLSLYRSIFGGGTAGGGSSTTIVQQVESPYALTDHAADRAIASVTVDNDCSIDSFVLKDGKVYDSVLYISNTANRTVTLTLPSGYVYKAIKGARPLSIPANSQSILSITRVANNVFIVSREDLETIQ